ncbi:cytochrome b [Endozoicomonas euniceicola]|uniref:Cytochrome b n=1 Tax=Endozoicomonas euniceicola TaxID=1234143 RepID=A0ABY6GZW0_9GAMM|nr:cytochrome b [Endozoicomonas euniceicola]UYM18210.1 cytochrome b [Endozoicomonas euniceicola]
METEKYPVLMRLMHWLMAITILGMIGSGWFMAGLDPDTAPYKYDIYFWHKSFGVLAMLLIVARIIIRLSIKHPKLSETLPSFEKALAKLAHFSMYLLMIAVPVSGLLMSEFSGKPIPFFGLTLPEVIENNKELAGQLHSIHTSIPFVLLGIIALHILGALKHRFMDSPENDVLKKML